MIDARTSPSAAVGAPAPVEVLPRGVRDLRVALAHDWLCGVRGGEHVLERIARAVIDQGCATPNLYVMFDEARPMSPAIDACRRVPSSLSRWPGSRKLRRWLLPRYPAAVEELSKRLAEDHARDPYDLVISTSSAAIKGLRPPPGVPHICYCHAPARYVWSQRDQYASAGVASLGLALYAGRFKAWDRATAANVTRFLANSTHIAAEISRCYDRQAEVLHPPVDTAFFTPDPAVVREDFWLVVGALEPYKRTDLAIQAAVHAGRRLVVVGTGSAERRLRRAASARVRFLGHVKRDELLDLYRRARVLIFPQIEDFGITAVEALSCGLPVIARRAGGALDFIDEGVTGAFFNDPRADSIVDAASRYLASAPPDAARRCRASAERFAAERFDRAIAQLLESYRAPR